MNPYRTTQVCQPAFHASKVRITEFSHEFCAWLPAPSPGGGSPWLRRGHPRRLQLGRWAAPESARTAARAPHSSLRARIVGYLCSSINAWRDAGKPIDRLGTLSAIELKEKLDHDEVLLLDVREPREWEEGYVREARRIYVGHLMAHTDGLPRDTPIASTCSVGYRGGLGASILKRSGFSKVYNVLGGMKAWRTRGYPLTKN
jgi:rhodanese-related sulfurtransferase